MNWPPMGRGDSKISPCPDRRNFPPFPQKSVHSAALTSSRMALNPARPIMAYITINPPVFTAIFGKELAQTPAHVLVSRDRPF